MELQEFIKQAVCQIVEAVVEAKAEIRKHDAEINPRAGHKVTDGDSYVKYYSEHRKIDRVEFDVAISAEENSGSKGGIGVVTGFVGVGTQKNSEQSNHAASRIRFTLPLLLPRGRDRSAELLTDKRESERRMSQ